MGVDDVAAVVVPPARPDNHGCETGGPELARPGSHTRHRLPEIGRRPDHRDLHGDEARHVIDRHHGERLWPRRVGRHGARAGDRGITRCRRKAQALYASKWMFWVTYLPAQPEPPRLGGGVAGPVPILRGRSWLCGRWQMRECRARQKRRSIVKRVQATVTHPVVYTQWCPVVDTPWCGAVSPPLEGMPERTHLDL